MDIKALVKEKFERMGMSNALIEKAGLVEQASPRWNVDCTEEAEESEESEEIKEIKETKETQEIKEIDELPAGVWDGISKVILTCAVGSDGNTNRPLFDLAREIRGCAGRHKIKFALSLLKQISERWKSANSQNLDPNKDYFIELIDKLYLVRLPAGKVLSDAFELAKNGVAPVVLKPFSRGVQVLACLCRELQRRAGKEPFFLDGRSAAQILGQAHTTVAGWLRVFCRLGVIQEVQKGHIGHASRYRYICPD